MCINVYVCAIIHTCLFYHNRYYLRYTNCLLKPFVVDKTSCHNRSSFNKPCDARPLILPGYRPMFHLLTRDCFFKRRFIVLKLKKYIRSAFLIFTFRSNLNFSFYSGLYFKWHIFKYIYRRIILTKNLLTKSLSF